MTQRCVHNINSVWYELSVYDVPMSNRVIWTSVCLLVRWREGEIKHSASGWREYDI